MQKKYTKPELDIVLYNSIDIICTSFCKSNTGAEGCPFDMSQEVSG